MPDKMMLMQVILAALVFDYIKGANVARSQSNFDFSKSKPGPEIIKAAAPLIRKPALDSHFATRCKPATNTL